MYHTIGAPGMGLLGKVIYIADYCEPERGFTDINVILKVANNDLDTAVAMIAKLQIIYLNSKGVVPHPNTIVISK